MRLLVLAAAAALAFVLPALADDAADLATAKAAIAAAKLSPAASPSAGGYRETEHVLRYYQTTRV